MYALQPSRHDPDLMFAVTGTELLLLSSGEISPFRLRLAERRADGLRLQLVSDGFQLPKVESEQPAGRKR